MAYTYKFVIGNLSKETTVESIIRFFELDKQPFSYKKFTSVSRAVKKNGQLLGMAFITVPVQLKNHVLGFSNQVLHGQIITVKYLHSHLHLLKHNQWVMEKDGVIITRSLRPEYLQKAVLKSLLHFFDFGANLLHRKFLKNIDSLIFEQVRSGVKTMILPGCCVAQSEKAFTLIKDYAGYLYFTAGTHPHFVDEFGADTIAAIRNMAIDGNCIAIGPAGMDFIHDNSLSSKEKQQKVFEAQVKLACEIGNRPIYVFERGAHSEVLTILTKYRGKLAGILIHDFSGTPDQAEAYIKIGCYIGVTWNFLNVECSKWILNGEFKAKVPLEQILLESCEGHCPTYLLIMAFVLSKIFRINMSEVIKIITITSEHFISDLTKPNLCKPITDELSYNAIFGYMLIISCIGLLFYIFLKYVFNM